MTEKPILFSSSMVNAILDGRKTQTRRVFTTLKDPNFGCELAASELSENDLKLCPYGIPGSLLWVKETFYKLAGKALLYRADCQNPETYVGWTPSIFMPRKLSRITLEIISVRVERVQDICEDDAQAEGVKHDGLVGYFCDEGDPNDPEDIGTHRCNWRAGFHVLWDSINAKRDGGKFSWRKNPYVWVISFKKL